MHVIVVRGHTVEIRYNGELSQHPDGTWGLAHRFSIDGGPLVDIYGLWDFMRSVGEERNHRITATLWDLLDGIDTPAEHRYLDTPTPTRLQRLRHWWVMSKWPDAPQRYAWGWD